MKSALIISTLSTIISAIATIALTPLLIRRLGPEVYGVYLLVISVASYGSFFDLGLTWAATRAFAEDFANDRLAEIAEMRSGIAVFYFFATASFLVAMICTIPVSRYLNVISWIELNIFELTIATGAFYLSLLSQLDTGLLRAINRPQPPAIIGLCVAGFTPIAVLAAAHVHPGAASLLVASFSVNLATRIVLARITRAELHTATVGDSLRRSRKQLVFSLLHFGGWSTVGRLSLLAVTNLDRLAVASIGSLVNLTYYAVPSSLGARVNIMGGTVAAQFFPRASQLWTKNEHAELKSQHSKAIRFMLVAATALCLPLYVYGKQFLAVWTNQAIAENGSPVLYLFVASNALISVTSIHAVTVEAAGHAKWTAISMSVWSVVAVLFVIMSAPHLSFLSVAIGVAGWQIAVGLTNVILCCHGELPGVGPTYSYLWSLAILICGYMVAARIHLEAHTLGSALLQMAGVSLCAAFASYLLVLSASDRSECFAQVESLFRTK